MIANQTRQKVLGATPQSVPTVTVGASATKSPVSKNIMVSYCDALNGVVDISVSAATVADSVDLVLQDSMDGTTWNDVITTAVTDTGTVTMRWNVQTTADQAFLPMRPQVRIVATTGVGDSITVDSILFATKG